MSNPQLPAELIDRNTTVVWLRRDLRLDDNTALSRALQENDAVLPLFVFDTCILDKLEDKEDRRVVFIHQALEVMKAGFEASGSSLLVLHGDPVAIFRQLTPKAVYANEDYEPYARSRDDRVASILKAAGSSLRLFKDQVVFAKNEVVKDNGDPYTVFTPYSRRWLRALDESMPFETSALARNNFKKTPHLPLPSLEDLGFKPVEVAFPKPDVNTALVRNYENTRDFPALAGTSRLGAHLRFGTLSIRTVTALALKHSRAWLGELIWREFFQMILWHFPYVQERSFKPAYDRIAWRNDPDEFAQWCEGKTGYPIVDAGMRELNATGFMHNRVRMITASFLTKHLLIDWRWGEAYFGRKLLDYDLAANNGNWQWAAGCGCDAAPYFRVFNPTLQAKKFDEDAAYVRRWVPEAGTNSYPAPIVDHDIARARALRVYREGLQDH